MFLSTIFYTLLSLALAKQENVLMTEVFEIVIDPPLFNWTYEGTKKETL